MVVAFWRVQHSNTAGSRQGTWADGNLDTKLSYVFSDFCFLVNHCLTRIVSHHETHHRGLTIPGRHKGYRNVHRPIRRMLDDLGDQRKMPWEYMPPAPYYVPFKNRRGPYVDQKWSTPCWCRPKGGDFCGDRWLFIHYEVLGSGGKGLAHMVALSSQYTPYCGFY